MTQIVLLGNTIPAISGHSGPHFDVGFWAGVQEKKDNQPLKGSLGVFWHVFRDLHALVPENLKKLESGDLKPDLTEGLKKVLKETFKSGAAAAKGLAEYYKWATDPSQSLFFIKKGTKCQWLVRKTGPYYYDEKPADPLWYPHRVPFEFVRVATEEEGKARLGIGMNTMIWIPYTHEEPKIGIKNTVEMPPKKKVEAAVNTVIVPVLAVTTPAKIDLVKEKPKRTRKKPEPKAVKPEPKTVTHIPIPIPVIMNPTPTPTYVEAIQEPLAVEETVIVKIKLFEHEGTSYFRDPVKNKLYTFKGPISVGPYIGRWCPHSLEIVTDVPDSDSED